MDKNTGPNGVAAASYEVGYGRPPKASRFGVRPQPASSARQARKQQTPDIAGLLDRPIEAKVGGKLVKLHPHEAMLHGLFQRAVAGETRAIKEFLGLCKQAGLLDPPPTASCNVIHVPRDVPSGLAGRLVRLAGAPPWEPGFLKQMKAEYEHDLAHLERLKLQAKAELNAQSK